MKNKEQVNKEFDENFVEMHPIHGHDMNNRPILYETDFSDIDEIKKFISSIRQNDVDELIEVLKSKELKPPYEDKDFEKEEDGKLTEVSLRNSVKQLKNLEGMGHRDSYNNALSDIITHLKSIKEKI